MRSCPSSKTRPTSSATRPSHLLFCYSERVTELLPPLSAVPILGCVLGPTDPYGSLCARIRPYVSNVGQLIPKSGVRPTRRSQSAMGKCGCSDSGPSPAHHRLWNARSPEAYRLGAFSWLLENADRTAWPVHSWRCGRAFSNCVVEHYARYAEVCTPVSLDGVLNDLIILLSATPTILRY
jgi:hypothetical protein